MAHTDPPELRATVALTGQQQRIVAHDRGPALVYAVAGAGKTTSVVHRVERLVCERAVAPQRILRSSFNKSAVDDLGRAHWPHRRARSSGFAETGAGYGANVAAFIGAVMQQGGVSRLGLAEADPALGGPFRGLGALRPPRGAGPAAAQAAHLDGPPYLAGERVMHPQFGQGVVLTVEAKEVRRRPAWHLSVSFPSRGVVKLLGSLAPLRRLQPAGGVRTASPDAPREDPAHGDPPTFR